MFENLQDLFTSASAMVIGLAVGCAWVAAVASPNCSYDKLDYSRADSHVRELLERTSTLIAGLLLAGTALAILGGSRGAAILSALAAAGFFSNRWTLSPMKSRQVAPGVKRAPKKKTQRVVAVSLSLMFGAAAAIAGVLAVFGV